MSSVYLVVEEVEDDSVVVSEDPDVLAVTVASVLALEVPTAAVLFESAEPTVAPLALESLLPAANALVMVMPVDTLPAFAASAALASILVRMLSSDS